MKQIQVFRAGLFRKRWAFRFIADNGEVVAQSELYSRKIDAEGTAWSVSQDYRDVSITTADE